MGTWGNVIIIRAFLSRSTMSVIFKTSWLSVKCPAKIIVVSCELTPENEKIVLAFAYGLKRIVHPKKM